MILNDIVFHSGIRSKDIIQKYSLTRKQFDYSFSKINLWLDHQKLPLIQRTQQGTFSVDRLVTKKITLEKFDNSIKDYILTNEERLQVILLLVLSRKESLSLLHLTSVLLLSKSTILADLRRLEGELEGKKLSLTYSRSEGYGLEGTESNKRIVLQEVIEFLLTIPNGPQVVSYYGQIDPNELQEMNSILSRIETSIHSKFTEDRKGFKNFYLLMVLRRISSGKWIEKNEHVEDLDLSKTLEFKAVQENLASDLPMEETLYLTLQLLSGNRSSEMTEINDTVGLREAVWNFLLRFEKVSCVEFQSKQEVVQQMVQHFHPAYYRIKYNLRIKNPFEVEINQHYAEIHYLVKKSLGPLQEFIGKEVPETESAYLALIIGGWMLREQTYYKKKIRAIVVCQNGVALSHFIGNSLEQMFSDFIFLDYLSVESYENYTLEYDIVFSTVAIETMKKLFIIKPLFNKGEKELLYRRVIDYLYGYDLEKINVEKLMNVIGKSAMIKDRKQLIGDLEKFFSQIPKYTNNELPTDNKVDKDLSDFITPENIQLVDRVEDWRQAIWLSAKPLVENGLITTKYPETIIDSFSEKNPYFILGKELAIPHAKPEHGVNKSSMSLLRSEEPIWFTDKLSVHVIVLIAAVDKKEHIKALTQLIKLNAEKKYMKAICKSTSVKEIYRIINIASGL